MLYHVAFMNVVQCRVGSPTRFCTTFRSELGGRDRMVRERVLRARKRPLWMADSVDDEIVDKEIAKPSALSRGKRAITDTQPPIFSDMSMATALGSFTVWESFRLQLNLASTGATAETIGKYHTECLPVRA